MKEIIPAPGIVLRGALAAGCRRWQPIVLGGPDSGKDANAGRVAPTSDEQRSADLAAVAIVKAKAIAKIPPAVVHYQTQPKGERRCGGCLRLDAESTACTLVDGPISPAGWCDLWARKA